MSRENDVIALCNEMQAVINTMISESEYDRGTCLAALVMLSTSLRGYVEASEILCSSALKA